MSVNRKTKIPFEGTKEQEKQLLEVLAKHKGTRGAVMLALQDAQDIYGYLPYEVQRIIAEELGVSMEEVYGVSTFYSLFTLNPKGKYKVAICMGTPCYILGAQTLIDECKRILNIETGGVTPDRKFSIDAVRCIGACALAPLIVVNEAVYGNIGAKDVEAILAKYN